MTGISVTFVAVLASAHGCLSIESDIQDFDELDERISSDFDYK